MAPSFRDLIDYLLADIALCGDQGASPGDILASIDAFYSRISRDQTADGGRSQRVDRPFQERVWRWLTQNPEVSVGKDKEGNHLSLAEAERLSLDGDDETKEVPLAGQPLRVFVSKERTWLAITGHEPDETKVLPTEFALLSIIASRKAHGIVQTELVRLSGQDKRSVPKRTDMLKQKGYIEKRAIQIKASRTSLCTLQKFVQDKPAFSSTQTPADRGGINAYHGADDIIDFEVFMDKLFETLKEYRIISRDDLKRVLGFADRWRWRILSRALRKFERIGVLKRVKAMSQYSDSVKSLYSCVMLIREPTKRDMELFNDDSKTLFDNLGQEDNASMELDDDLEPEGNAKDASTLGNDRAVGVVKQEMLQDEGRTLPIWTPDRNMHNLIFDIIDSAGTSGRTNHNTIQTCFGGFFRRPLENALNRLVECWQLSQPPHLRHLALVRDTAQKRTVFHYVHYSARNFKKLVDSGDASWEAVEFVPKDSKIDPRQIPPVDAVPQLDENGLPLVPPAANLLRNGNATLRELIQVCQPADYIQSSSDPLAVRLRDGSYGEYTAPRTFLCRAAAVSQGRPQSSAREGQEELDLDEAGHEDRPVIKRVKKPKNDPDRFKGMTEKEKLEALGLNESYTEYSVLLIDRPRPGVYVTARGRRRPVGEARGRPRISRIAVFKTPQLNTLPWFVEARSDSVLRESAPSDDIEMQDAGTPATDDQGREMPHPEATDLPSSSQALKRQHEGRDSEEERAVQETHTRPRQGRKQKTKQPCLDKRTDITTTQQIGILPDDTADRSVNERIGDTPLLPPSDRAKRKRRMPKAPGLEDVDTPAPSVQESEGISEAPPKKQRRVEAGPSSVLEQIQGDDYSVIQSTEHVSTEPIIQPEPILKAEMTVDEGIIPTSTTETAIQGPLSSIPGTPVSFDREQTADVRESSKVSDVFRHSRGEKRGSVAVLRKKIVMEIVERAGGAFPMGTELWYPFTTAWLKMKNKEKPDLRTLKTVVKQMVDAGKLRQLFFSGKDSKGVMVTKSIITKPDLAPDDPLVMNMQKAILAEESKFYFPENTEINPELTKGKGAIARDISKPVPSLPVEAGITVQLHHKPAYILAKERRKGRNIQRRLLQSLAPSETMGERRRASKSGVVRLMSVFPPPPQAGHPPLSLDSLTSIQRPLRATEKRPYQRRRSHMLSGLLTDGSRAVMGRMRRGWKAISTMAPYAMLMNPRQVFHANTGTFSTNAGLAAVRKLAWRGEAKVATKLPDSLDDLLTNVTRRAPDYSDRPDPRSSQFFQETDVISRWELQNEDLLQRKGSGLRYINQTVRDSFETVPIEGVIQFNPTEFLEPSARAIRPRSRRLAPRPSSPTARYDDSVLSDEDREEEGEEEEDYDDDDGLPEVPDGSWKRRNRVSAARTPNRRLNRLNASLAAETPSPISAPRSSVRRSRMSRHLSESFVQRLMTAIAAIRTLAGGIEGKNIDWNLVARALPGYDTQFVQERGRVILNKSRLQVVKMQSDFQERFIEAYEKDQVPRIDYENLDGYDWETVVDWAITQLDIPTSSEKLPDLPATREQFDSMFELREEAIPPVDEIYQVNSSMTLSKKRNLVTSTPFSILLAGGDASRTSLSQRRAELSRLEVAKTWVRANVTAPEETYNPADARRALGQFDELLISQAMQSLVTERIISMGNRGRITPGRNYDLTDHFLVTLGRKRAIDSTQLRRAAHFKTSVLDPALRSQGVFEIGYNAEDGDVLAVVNLAAEGRVTLRPRDPPRDRHGLTDGGYLTRQMDKEKLRFAVDVHPERGKYVFGNPIRERASTIPPPPAFPEKPPASDDGPKRIPIWFDIHGQFVQVLWDLVVAAVVGCVAVRPGISAAGIARMIHPSAGAWEVRLLLEWLAAVGVARGQTVEVDEHTGWVVQEWWWMLLGTS
ncbi:hypothetical protein ASPZODRAFT_55384 [Penicilliopsis zonata CBS 506.65]|uniref:Uncharacterized protein n=1 Tax=Penicilliopsis zonata CBS 506.65 TaxID=1073090 RepID=A0A1L9SVL7_9EURO|nr:hypothetical protein ASPZODRAFT_55384 [Penicilliopsis zonata CBS 506.65]OJJ51229.1 hypothetical protein ASPZODRAFT_55384 [Penicilliopsis zonata CBS 506.65]